MSRENNSSVIQEKLSENLTSEDLSPFDARLNEKLIKFYD